MPLHSTEQYSTEQYLSELWPEQCADHWPQQAIGRLILDSRKVQAGDVFFALKGSQQASRLAEFVQSALDQGAAAVFSEVELPQFAGQPVFFQPDLRDWIGVLAQRWLQHTQAVHLPKIAAVTGTNGKTTVTRLLAELLHLAGFSSAAMGTTGNGVLPNIEPSTHTTVDAIQLQQQLYQFGQQGALYACLEASSHGLDQGRLAGTAIEVAIFTNLTRDHLDYHGTLEHYAAAKAKLFAFNSLSHVILNADDPAYTLMRDSAVQAGHAARIWTYSLHDFQHDSQHDCLADSKHDFSDKPPADFQVQQVAYSLTGAQILIHTPHGPCQLHSPLLGHFNVSNLLAAVAGAMAFGLSVAEIERWVPLLQGAPGRMQVVSDQSRLFVVDYAHTPDALEQVLRSLRHHVAASAQLWVVFGCGGDRDRGKRPLMTQVASELADQVILTADNPRHETVTQILDDMLAGLDGQQQRLRVEPDRRLAIRQVVNQASAQDIVVIAGKGHETYQEIEGVRHWFDDVVELRAALGLNSAPPPSYPA